MAEARAQDLADLPEGYCMTELGPLPEEWRVVKIAETIEEIMTGTWGKEYEIDGSITCLVIRGTDFPNIESGDFSAVPLRFIKISQLQKRRLSPGDLLVELSGGSKAQPTGRILLITSEIVEQANRPLLYTNFVKKLRLRSEVIPVYFRLYWEFLYRQGRTKIYEKRTTGIRNFRINDFLENELIPLPPLSEQRAIAHVLRTVQEAREATERVIAALRDLKRSLMRHLFTYGPVPVNQADQVALQDTPIGPLPAHWRVVRLGEVATLQRGKDLPRRKRKPGQIPVIGSNGIVGWHAEFVARGPGVCVGRSWSVGKVTWIENNFWPLNTVLWVKDFHGNNPRFVYYLLAQFDFSPYIGGVSVPTLNRNLIHPIKVPLPPLDEQREITRILQTVDRKIEAEENWKQALEALFKTLLHHLMTAKVRVELHKGTGGADEVRREVD